METSSTSAPPLTSEDLQSLVLNGKRDTLVTALSALQEKDRRKLSKHAYTLYSVAQKKWHYMDIPEKHKALTSKVPRPFIKPVLARAQCAVMGVCPLSKVKNVNQWMHEDTLYASMLSILQDRQPAWLSEWVEHQLASPNARLTWPFARKLQALGLISKPEGLNYVQAMVEHHSLCGNASRQHRSTITIGPCIIKHSAPGRSIGCSSPGRCIQIAV